MTSQDAIIISDVNLQFLLLEDVLQEKIHAHPRSLLNAT